MYNNIKSALDYLSWKAVPDTVMRICDSLQDNVVNKWSKCGKDNLLDTLGQYLKLWPGQSGDFIPGDPKPLTSMLVGGALGTTLGYGAGGIASMVLPRSFKRRNLARTGALIGGMAGATPGLLWGLVNKADSRNFNDNELFQRRGVPAQIEHDIVDYYTTKVACYSDSSIKNKYLKLAQDYPSTGVFGPAIDLNKFITDVWADPNLTQQLSPRMQAAATGLVAAAAKLPDKQYNSNIITPYDVARISAGMGAGYLSGMLVGKALGVLTGMPESTQNLLKNTGMYASILSNIIPIAYGG